MDPRERLQHGATGALYLVTHVTSVTALIAYRSGHPIAGVSLEFLLAIGCGGTGVLLRTLLQQYGPTRAATFAALRTVEASVILAGTLPMLALAWATAPTDRLRTMANDAHDAAFLVGQGLVIAVNTLVLAWLLWDSGRVPRALAVLGLVGGTLVLISNTAQLWGVIAFSGTVAGAAAVPIFAFELWLAIHLIVTGARGHGGTRRP